MKRELLFRHCSTVGKENTSHRYIHYFVVEEKNTRAHGNTGGVCGILLETLFYICGKKSNAEILVQL